MEHYEFKSAIPIEHLLHVIDIVRKQGVAGNVDDILICLGSAMGELGTYIKSFETPLIGSLDSEDINDVAELSLNECCMMLEARLLSVQSLQSVDSAPTPAAIDPQTLLVIFQLAMKLFELLRSRR